MKTRIYQMSFLIVLAFALLAFTTPQEQKKGAPWKISAEYKNKANPHKGDASLDKVGKTLYAKHCKSCHGNLGLGDGPKAKNLKTFAGDFSDAKWQASVTDGEMYFMSFIGRDEMPNFESLIPEQEDRWAVVNYIRTLKK